MRRAAAALAALASFVPLPLPPGATPGSGSSTIVEFAASGTTWLARTDRDGQYQLTTDAGATWRTLDTEIGPGVGMAVDPGDGSFWAPGTTGFRGSRQNVLVHVTADGRLTTVPVDYPGTLSAPAWDEQKRMWVAAIQPGAGSSDALISAVRLAPDGSVAEHLDITAGRFEFAFIKFAGGAGYIATDLVTVRFTGGKISLLSGTAEADTEFTQFQPWPVTTVGRTIVGWHTISTDGGRTFSYTERGQFGVQGTDDLLVRWPFDDQVTAVVLKRCSSFVYCETGLRVPQGTAALWQTPAGLVAVSAESTGPLHPLPTPQTLLEVHRGALPPVAVQGGRPAPRARALMARINHFRRAAGSPPVMLDPAMSRAAYSHARYLALHVARGRLDLGNAHSETPGRRGFTGSDASARCARQHTGCTTEEVIPGAHPVDATVSIYYHRIAMLSSRRLAALRRTVATRSSSSTRSVPDSCCVRRAIRRAATTGR